MSAFCLRLGLAALAISPLFTGLFWLLSWGLSRPTLSSPDTARNTSILPSWSRYGFWAWLALSLFTLGRCLHPEEHLAGLLSRYALPTLLCWMAYRALKQGRWKSEDLLQGLLWASLLMAGLGLGHYLLSAGTASQSPSQSPIQALCLPQFDSACLLNLTWGATDRASGLSMHPNILGTLLCLSLPLWLQQLYQGPKKRHVWLFSSLLLVLICLGFTYSRAAWLVALPELVLGSLWLLSPAQRKSLALVLGLGLVPLSLKGPLLLTRLQSLLRPSQGSSGTRLLIWQTGGKLLQHFAWTGAGLLHIEEYYRDYRSVPVEAAHLHNWYLQVAVESGLPAALLFFALLFQLWGRPPGRQASATWKAVWLSGLGLGLISLVDCPSLDLRVAWTTAILVALLLWERRQALGFSEDDSEA